MPTRTMDESSTSCGKLPGSSVKSPKAWLAPRAASSEVSATGDAEVGAFVFTLFPDETLVCCVCASLQFHQFTLANSTAAAASAQAAKIAAERAFAVRCRMPNSCRSRISTRCGVSASRVVSRSACNAIRASCHESCSAAQPGHRAACAAAASCKAASSSPIRSPLRSRPIASNSSHFITHFLQLLLRCCGEAPRRIPQDLQLGEQQSPPAMQPRTDRTDRATAELRRLFVAELFQFAQHDGLAELRGEGQHRGAYTLGAFLLLGPMRRR